VEIAELKRQTVAELHGMADGLQVEHSEGLTKPELILKIGQSLLDAGVSLHAEGVLEILPEGYGFLRSQDWSYLAGPDDVYVSPSQIKRFDLRTGDEVFGEVRPPKARSKPFRIRCPRRHSMHGRDLCAGWRPPAAASP